MYAVVCLWKFGFQCPTSPLLPPRKVPLEYLIHTSCTDPIPQPAAARTPRLHQPSAVTHLFYAHVRKATDTEFNVFMLGRDLILLNVLQQVVQQLFAQLLSFLRHNTSRNSWFTFIAIAGKRFLRLVVQTLALNPGDMMCLRLVVQLVLSADIADIIVADHNFFQSAMLTSSSLIPALLNNRDAKVMVADSRFLQ
ncbi:hypothetical protein F511_29943 [Dorcoceras hygrometricum]|uniref:Uncharacterized protein n=1 Tax=Dorcoceras hygrometricum TaxID=472368 RepID=A0A2Z7D681_9LAMI|nr:hypothetical protein F511_29943 [Dorcoceras hygrometricum]